MSTTDISAIFTTKTNLHDGCQ